MDTIQINYDSLKKHGWNEQETKNVELIIGFVQELMNNHNFNRVLEKYGNPKYRQHNRSIPDGMESLVEYVRKFVKRFPEYAYDVKHIYADGNFVIFHSQITTSKKDIGDDGKGFNVTDTWRIENGQIVEHWDSLQPMNTFLRFYFWLIGGKIANNNGVY